MGEFMKEKWVQWIFCRIPIFLIMVLFLGVLFVYFGKDTPAGKNTAVNRQEEEKFVEFTKDMFRSEAAADMLTLNYTLSEPERYGIKEERGFGSYSLEAMEQGIEAAKQKEEELKKIDYDSLSKHSQFLYDILIEEFENCQKQQDFIYFSENLRPKSGVTAQLPILLTEYHFYEEKNIEEYLELLCDIPEYFEEILEFQKLKLEKGLFMDDVWAGEIIEQCRDFAASGKKNLLITAFEQKIDAATEGEGRFSLSSTRAEEYKKAHRDIVLKQVLPSFERLGAGIEDLVAKRNGSFSNKKKQKEWANAVGNPQGLALYENGRAYYEFMIKNLTGTKRSIEEVDEMLSAAIEEQKTKVREAFLDKETFALYDKEKMPAGEPKELLNTLREKISADFTPLSSVAALNNCELDEERLYTLKYVDKSMEDILSPAFYLTPAIDNFQENTIYINRKKMKQGESLFATLGHEAYPGHMYQMVYFALRQENPLRYILNFPGYSEGWGTYAEVYSYEMAGLGGKMADVETGSLILNLSIFGRLDIGVNYYGWSKDNMKKYLGTLGLAKNVDIDKVYQLMVEEPGMYLKYIVGYLEIMELKKMAKVKLGSSYSDKWFHDFLLQTGPAPFGLIEKKLREYIPEKRYTKALTE